LPVLSLTQAPLMRVAPRRCLVRLNPGAGSEVRCVLGSAFPGELNPLIVAHYGSVAIASCRLTFFSFGSDWLCKHQSALGSAATTYG
jgi:hypothetical protein